MHEIHINIIQLQTFQTLIQICLHVFVVSAPKLGGHEDIFSLDSLGEGTFQALPNFVFVAVAPCGVDVAVPVKEGVLDSNSDGTGGGLPCA